MRKSEFDALGAHILGVSADKPALQQTFIDTFGLQFPLIPDTGKHIIDAYGSREVLGIVAKRKTFLIAPDGTIAHVWPAVKVEGHVDEVLAVLRELASGGSGS